MKPRLWFARWRRSSLPLDIYASHVAALHSDAKSLTVGVVAACLTTLGTGILIWSPAIVGLAVALAVLGVVRLRFMHRFQVQRPNLTEPALTRWERGYVLGGTLHLALLGAFCLLAFIGSDDPFARLASLSITMAYLIGTPGRSFASDLLVDAQILVSAVAVIASLLFGGPRYLIIVLFVMVPFFMALKTISSRLRDIFQSAVIRARDLSILAGRFDTALTNMPHGLAMFGPDGTVTVANAQFGALLSKTAGPIPGRSISEILGEMATSGVHAQGCPSPAEQGEAWLHSGARAGWVSKMEDGRSLAFTLQPMEVGGGVIIAEDVTERVRAEASLAYLARFDGLTSLPNRHSFQGTVSARLQGRPDQNCALLFIDLDRFKSVNDTLGHAIGDQLLKAVAERLRLSVRADAVVARFGGDEFVLFQHFADVPRQAAQLAAEIIARLSEPFRIDDHALVIGATIGIAEAAVAGATVETLLRDADLALYRAKAAGRGTFRFFEGEMQAWASARRELETDLRASIALGQLSLHYQPMLDCREGRFTTCEALLRWHHPTRGLVSPAVFIPIAEEIGFISELGRWVLNEACQECARWPHSVRVAVNVSALQFRRGDLVELALRAVRTAGIGPGRLEIEITESALLHDLKDAQATLRQLQRFGFRLALDDFGTGYSSLSYLRSLPFDKIKVDRSFLDGSTEDARVLKVLRGITRMSADLGMSVVMEGVETAEQLTLVTVEAGVQEVQGYLISRPVPADAIRLLLAYGSEKGDPATRALSA